MNTVFGQVLSMKTRVVGLANKKYVATPPTIKPATNVIAFEAMLVCHLWCSAPSTGLNGNGLGVPWHVAARRCENLDYAYVYECVRAYGSDRDPEQ